MIAVNKQVKVMPSFDLAEMRLSGLAGRKGVVTERVFGSGSNPIGYMVLLDKSFQGEYLWFLPETALSHEEDSQ